MEPQEVITIVDGTLYRYHVERYSCGPRSQDDLMAGYTFVQVEPDQGRLVFSSLVSTTVWSELNYGEDAEMSRKAIALGLQQAGRMTHTGSVQLKMDVLSELQSEDDISDTMVRYRILAFMYSVNCRFPQEWVSRNSVMYNVSGVSKSVEDWVDSLVEAEYLLRHHAKEVEIDGKSVLLMDVYRINPTTFPQIKRELEDSDYLASGDTLRAFISYSTKDKVLAGKIKTCLENSGLSVFLAHEDLDISDEWMEKIVEELKSCHVFIPLLTDNYKGSDWTDQEAGYALAFDKKVCPLKVPHNPHGFIRRKQGEPVADSNVEPACEKIVGVIRKDEKLGPLLAKAASQSS